MDMGTSTIGEVPRACHGPRVVSPLGRPNQFLVVLLSSGFLPALVALPLLRLLPRPGFWPLALVLACLPLSSSRTLERRCSLRSLICLASSLVTTPSELTFSTARWRSLRAPSSE